MLDYLKVYREAGVIQESIGLLKSYQTQLRQVQSQLHQCYKSKEMLFINQALDDTENTIALLMQDLDQIEKIIRKTAYDLYQDDLKQEMAIRNALINRDL